MLEGTQRGLSANAPPHDVVEAVLGVCCATAPRPPWDPSLLPRRAKNPLTSYPEYAELKNAIATVRRDGREALRMETDACVAVRELRGAVQASHRHQRLLADLLADELEGLRKREDERTAGARAMAQLVAALETRQAELHAWAETLRSDVVDLRGASERAMNREAAELRRLLAVRDRDVAALATRLEACEARLEQAGLADDAAGSTAEPGGARGRAGAALAAADAARAEADRARREAAEAHARAARVEDGLRDVLALLRDRAERERRGLAPI